MRRIWIHNRESLEENFEAEVVEDLYDSWEKIIGILIKSSADSFSIKDFMELDTQVEAVCDDLKIDLMAHLARRVKDRQ